MLETIKRHPYVAVGAVVAVVAIILLMGSGGDTVQAGGVVQPDPTSVAAGAAIQTAQIQAGIQGKAIDADLQKASMAYAAEQYEATLQADAFNNNLQASKDVAFRQADSTDLLNTLQARVAEANINSATQIAIGNQLSQVKMADIFAEVTKATSKIQADTYTAINKQNTDLQKAIQQSNEDIAKNAGQAQVKIAQAAASVKPPKAAAKQNTIYGQIGPVGFGYSG